MIATSCVLAALALVSAGVAFAQDKAPPFKAADYPLEVRKSMSDAVLTCRQRDGGKLTFAPDTVRRVDFNGDGRDDYIVNLEEATCSTFETIFCGTGGCVMDFLVTMPDGTIRSLFREVALAYEILPDKVRFWLHHGRCAADTRTGECVKDVRIAYKPFTLKPKG